MQRCIKALNLVLLLIVAVAISVMFYIKAQVHDLSYQVRQLAQYVKEEENNINILKAEVAYLSSPERIRKLANNSLALKDIKSGQLSYDPFNDTTDNVAHGHHYASLGGSSLSAEKSNSHVKKMGTKWRYKNSYRSPVKTVSSHRKSKY
jgi:cell division protein FtsL